MYDRNFWIVKSTHPDIGAHSEGMMRERKEMYMQNTNHACNVFLGHESK